MLLPKCFPQQVMLGPTTSPSVILLNTAIYSYSKRATQELSRSNTTGSKHRIQWTQQNPNLIAQTPAGASCLMVKKHCKLNMLANSSSSPIGVMSKSRSIDTEFPVEPPRRVGILKVSERERKTRYVKLLQKSNNLGLWEIYLQLLGVINYELTCNWGGPPCNFNYKLEQLFYLFGALGAHILGCAIQASFFWVKIILLPGCIWNISLS